IDLIVKFITKAKLWVLVGFESVTLFFCKKLKNIMLINIEQMSKNAEIRRIIYDDNGIKLAFVECYIGQRKYSCPWIGNPKSWHNLPIYFQNDQLDAVYMTLIEDIHVPRGVWDDSESDQELP